MNDNSNINVQIRAEDGQLRQGMERAASETERAASRMREALNTASSRMSDAFAHMKAAATNATTGMSQAFSAARDQMHDAALGMTGAMSGVVRAMAALPGPAKAAAVAVAGIVIGKQFADSAAKTTESAMDLARVLGSTTNVAQQWRIALDDVGASQGELEGAAKGMARQLRENEDEMNKLGLVTRDANGSLRPMTELLQDGIGIVNQYKEGVDRAQVAQTVFGRGVDASSKLLLINNDTLSASELLMKQFGLEVGGNAVKAWKEFDEASDTASAGMKGLGYTIGGIVMPVIADLISAFNAAIPAAIAVCKAAVGTLATAFHVLKNGVVVTWETINAMVVTVAEPIRALAEAIGRAVVGDFDGAARAIKGIGGVIGGAWEGAMQRIAESSQKTNDRIKAIWSADTAPGDPIGERGTRNAPREDKKKTKHKEESQMPIYEAELARRIEAFEKAAQEEGTLRQYSKREEADYWKSVSQMSGITAEDKARAEKKWRDIERGLRTDAFAVEMAQLEQQKADARSNFDERIRLAEEAHRKTVAMYGAESKEAAQAFGKVTAEKRQQAEQIKQIDEISIQRRRDLALSDIEAQTQDAQLSFELGLITREQLLELERQHQERMTEIKRKALQDRLGSIDPQADSVKKAEIDAQIEQLELQHRQRMAEINNKTVLQSTLNMRSMMGSVESSWASTIGKVMSGTMSMAQGIRGLFKGVVDSVIAMLAQMAAKWMVQQIMMRMFGKASALGEISMESAKAGAGGVASMAAAPFPLNLSAPAFGAAMAAAAAAFAPMAMASAAGGYDIPAGVNPLTQLHQSEMVLPANIAQPLREAIVGGSSFGGAGGSVHIHARNDDDVVRVGDMKKLLRQMGRNFVDVKR